MLYCLGAVERLMQYRDGNGSCQELCIAVWVLKFRYNMPTFGKVRFNVFEYFLQISAFELWISLMFKCCEVMFTAFITSSAEFNPLFIPVYFGMNIHWQVNAAFPKSATKKHNLFRQQMREFTMTLFPSEYHLINLGWKLNFYWETRTYK